MPIISALINFAAGARKRDVTVEEKQDLTEIAYWDRQRTTLEADRRLLTYVALALYCSAPAFGVAGFGRIALAMFGLGAAVSGLAFYMVSVRRQEIEQKRSELTFRKGMH